MVTLGQDPQADAIHAALIERIPEYKPPPKSLWAHLKEKYRAWKQARVDTKLIEKELSKAYARIIELELRCGIYRDDED